MKVCLLYENRERAANAPYYDQKSIIQDLGLSAVFSAAAKELTYENGELKQVEAADLFVLETFRNVMMTPLLTEEEIVFRQEIVKDCLRAPKLIRGLYRVSTAMLAKWNELGRGARERIRAGNPVVRLTTEIRVLRLFVDSLAATRYYLNSFDSVTSRGLQAFREEFFRAFPEELEADVRKVLADIAFYMEGLDTKKDEERNTVVKPRIVFECGLEDGLKMSSVKLCSVGSEDVKYVRPGSAGAKLRKFVDAVTKDGVSTVEDAGLTQDTRTLQFGVVSYLLKRQKGWMDGFATFFDQLRLQSAFYLGAVQLAEHMNRLKIGWCFPKVCDRRDLVFADLRELTMALTQRVNVIGNTCELRGKDVLIVTGANQGGKSTFLRSVSLAQVMMQCGLPVAASQFQSGIFPRIFVHFTRREDSAMNSGRLDEELRRMNGIVEHVGDGSLVILNESFATTTEKEGSVIAYDIIRALAEAGVRVLTVTHLLSFAKRVYEEEKNVPDSPVEFLSAERLPDGTRTFRMIRSEPELTSFGLDLYDAVVGKVADLATARIASEKKAK